MYVIPRPRSRRAYLNEADMTIRTMFPSGAGRCAAWLTLPAGNGPHPAILLVHGGGATHAMMLEQYERWFAAAGFAVVAFDFRHLGDSDGEPRQLMNLRRYFEDIDAALAFIAAHPELDARRVALWGTSFGASHVVVTAARRPDIAAAVIQCPILQGRAPALRSGLLHLLRFTGPIASDLLRAALGLPRRYVPIVGRPGEFAFVNVPGAYEGWHSVMPEGYTFDNRVPAGAGLTMLFYDAAAMARRVRCPLLVCISDKETLMDPAVAAKAAQDAPHGVARHYAADHFEVYHPPLVGQIVADQIAFLSEHLRPGT
ncbi:MAG: alpha/beta fold hydrolase [Alphaproteobacteria bacterium]|nr:alpha/beta fold hydrolase [Alphaproteobacteria bacterium]